MTELARRFEADLRHQGQDRRRRQAVRLRDRRHDRRRAQAPVRHRARQEKIHLEQPDPRWANTKWNLHLHAEVKSTLKVRVESTTPLAAPTEAGTNRAQQCHGDCRRSLPQFVS
jgi:hypothetical protein